MVAGILILLRALLSGFMRTVKGKTTVVIERGRLPLYYVVMTALVCWIFYPAANVQWVEYQPWTLVAAVVAVCGALVLLFQPELVPDGGDKFKPVTVGRNRCILSVALALVLSAACWSILPMFLVPLTGVSMFLGYRLGDEFPTRKNQIGEFVGNTLFLFGLDIIAKYMGV
jgi:fucose 4-O-acetylase-like acetyltransferase